MPIIYRRRFANDPISTGLLAIACISIYLWLRCTLWTNLQNNNRQTVSPAQLIVKTLPGFCARCRDSSLEFELKQKSSNNCEIFEQDPSSWLFTVDKKTTDLVPAWYRSWNDYRRFFPVGVFDPSGSKRVEILWKDSNKVEVDSSNAVYFRYLTNPGLSSSSLRNLTIPWRSDMTSSLFKRLPRYETEFQRGHLAEHWNDGLRERFMAQNKWYKLYESGIKEGDIIEKGTEKKVLKQWKNLVESTMSETFLSETDQNQFRSGFEYSAPFSRSIRPLKKFLEKYQHFIKNKRVLVIGSTYPWVEFEVLVKGAYHVTSVTEFDLKSILPSNHRRLSHVHPRKMDRLLLVTSDEKKTFDFAISFSFLEHAGLGRYGDPLNPDADLMEMAKLSCVIQPGGLLLLSVPVDGDCIEYSYRRFYGPVRYSLLTECWRVVEFESFNVDDCKTRDWTYQPWFLLQNMHGCPITSSA